MHRIRRAAQQAPVDQVDQVDQVAATTTDQVKAKAKAKKALARQVPAKKAAKKRGR